MPSPSYPRRSRYDGPQDTTAPMAPMSGGRTTVTTTTRGATPAMPMAPMSPMAARKAERRQNFEASVNRTREEKQTRVKDFAANRAAGLDERTARFNAHNNIPLAPKGQAPAAPPPDSPYRGGTVDPAKKEFHESKIRQAKDAFSRIPEFGDEEVLGPQRQAAQEAIDAAYAEQQTFLNPPPPEPAAQPAAPEAPAAPPAPFVSQKGRMAISEQMLKTMFDAAVERSPNRNEAAAEFERTAAQYGVDGRRLLLNWMGEHDGGENPLGYSTEERGGELREVPAAPPAPPAPNRVLAGASGRAGMYETNQGTVMLNANGQKVGPTMAPPAPPAPQQAGRRVELVEGPYRGFRPVPRGPQPGSGASPESVATMQQAITNATPTATNHQTGQKWKLDPATNQWVHVQ